MAEARDSGLSPFSAGSALARPPVLEHLAVALDMRAGREQLHPVRAGLELADRGRRDAHDVAGAQVEDLVVDLDPARAVQHDVHLLGLPVAMTEARALARLHPVVADADSL